MKKEKEYPDGYARVPIPEELIREIDLLLKKRKYGFKSRAEFVKEAIRRYLLEIEKTSSENE